MEPFRGLTEAVDAIRTLRELGAIRVRIGDIEVTFADTSAALAGLAGVDLANPKPDTLSPEERAKVARETYEATLFHSAE